MKNVLMKLIQDNLKAPKKYEIVNKDEESEIYIYDIIGEWGVDAAQFARDLKSAKGTVHLRINSPGGDAFAGKAIQTAIAQHKGKTIAHIDGLAASAATYIALAADEVEMSEGALFMIHKASSLAWGNSDDLLQIADLLDKVDDSIVNDYAKKTGLDADQIKNWMADETWFSAEEALESGFVDSIYKTEKTENIFDLSAYDNAPKVETKQVDTSAHEHRLRELELIERMAS